MRLHRRILGLIEDNAARMVDGEVVTVDPLTVTAGPSTVAVTAVSLLPVSVGDKVQIVQQGANRLVLGRARATPFIQSAASAVSLSASGGSVTFPVAFPTVPVVTLTAESSGSATSRTLYLTAVSATGFSFRAYDNNAELTTGTRVVHWQAIVQ